MSAGLVLVIGAALLGCKADRSSAPDDAGINRPPARGPLAYDLVDRLPTARVFTERAGLDFGDPRDSVRLVSGWGRAEEHLKTGATFAWANAPSSELLLDVAGSGPRRLILRGWPYRSPDGSHQTVTASINGRTVGAASIGRLRRRIAFDVPEGVLVPGRNTVRFDYTYVASPADVQSGSKDQRQLAVAFEQLEVEPAVVNRIDGEPRPVVEGEDTIRQPAATALVFEVFGPSGGVLALGADLSAEVDGIAEVWVRPEDGDPRLLMRFIPGRDHPRDRTADVADLAGRRFDLVLSVSGSRGAVRWLRPRIVGEAT